MKELELRDDPASTAEQLAAAMQRLEASISVLAAAKGRNTATQNVVAAYEHAADVCMTALQILAQLGQAGEQEMLVRRPATPPAAPTTAPRSPSSHTAPQTVGASSHPTTGADPRSSSATSPPGRSREVAYTDEQQAVIVSKDPKIVVRAFAGTGKTSTLVGYAAHHSHKRMLYIAFNKTVAQEAERRFPSNVKARTSHSLAFASHGRTLQHKLGNPRARDVIDLVESGVRTGLSAQGDRYVFAQRCMEVLRVYLCNGSTKEGIDEDDAQSIYPLPSGVRVPGAVVAKGAQLLWQAMRDPAHALSAPHDVYLKLYQLSRPQLRFDKLLVDEAQDTNPTLLQIVNGQACEKVMVGDSNQAIYGFRMAIDAMTALRGAREYCLTQSFRFGPGIADVANHLLGVFKQETVRIEGAGAASQEPPVTRAELYRTNAGLFDGAVHALGLAGGGAGAGSRICLVGGAEGYNMDLLVDTWRLKAGEIGMIKDPFLRRFNSFGQLEEYTEAVEDKELASRIKIVGTYADRIPALVSSVKAAHVSAEGWQADAGAPPLHLTTAHKSKGLEWDRVRLGDDFPELMNQQLVPRAKAFVSGKDGDMPIDEEELHLYYVAATRARQELLANTNLADFLAWCKRNPGVATGPAAAAGKGGPKPARKAAVKNQDSSSNPSSPLNLVDF